MLKGPGPVRVHMLLFINPVPVWSEKLLPEDSAACWRLEDTSVFMSWLALAHIATVHVGSELWLWTLFGFIERFCSLEMFTFP